MIKDNIKILYTQIKNNYHYFAFVLFILLGIIGIINHEMWRDELQAWLIAKNSGSLINLFQNFRYEGHPGLWFMILYYISRFTHNPVSMQFAHLLIASAAVFLFLKYSPFSKLQKLLFIFGYFPFYEYSIISRNYSLGMLFIFLFCTLYCTKKNFLLLAGVIFLLAQTNIFGLIIAIALSIFLLPIIIISLLLKFKENHSIIFKQDRIGFKKLQAAYIASEINMKKRQYLIYR